MKLQSNKNIPGAGFSLVEVSLAIGLISCSLLALVGLLPGGMQTLHASMETTTHALIVQSIAEELNVSDLNAAPGMMNYFDGSGQRAEPDAATYEVTVHDEQPSLPGLDEAGATDLHAHLKRIRIEIKDVSNTRTCSYALHVATR